VVAEIIVAFLAVVVGLVGIQSVVIQRRKIAAVAEIIAIFLGRVFSLG
jgi:hypothetical protein